MYCKFKQRCENKDKCCESCCRNPSAYLGDSFEWNGEGEEPDLDEYIEEMLEF